MTLGNVTSVNIKTLEVGVKMGDIFAYNCVPSVEEYNFGIHISPHFEAEEIGDMIDTCCQECGTLPDKRYKVGYKSLLEMGPMNDKYTLTKTGTSNP